jgi:hypothetical protein
MVNTEDTGVFLPKIPDVFQRVGRNFALIQKYWWILFSLLANLFNVKLRSTLFNPQCIDRLLCKQYICMYGSTQAQQALSVVDFINYYFSPT